MAIGDLTIKIDGSDFINGMSTSALLNNGGFSPESTGINPIAEPGVIHAANEVTNKSTNLTGSAIAYCPSTVTSSNGYILAGDGKIMSIDSSQALTASSALTGTYTTGTSDIAQFIDKIYATSSTDVARMNTDLTAGDATWWSVTLGKGTLTSGVRHPVVDFIGYLWVGDNNALHQIVNSGAGNKNALLLTSGNEITALGVDQSSSQMLIATTQGANYSGTISTGNRIFVYDGVSAVPSKEVNVDGMVTGFRNVGGVTYVCFGQKIGYWNGSGVTFLRALANVTLSGSDLAYKHHMTNIENILYVVDGAQIMAFGEIIPGKKVWYYPLFNTVNSNKYSLVCPVGNNQLGLGFATNLFYIFPIKSITNVITGGATFYSKKYLLDDKYTVRKVRVKFKSTFPASATQIGTLTVYGENSDTYTETFTGSAVRTYYEVESTPTLNPSGSTTKVQVSWAFTPATATNVYGIEQIMIYLTKAE